MEQTNPLTSHTVYCKMEAPLYQKLWQNILFFLWNGYINRVCYIFFLIMEITLLNNVNLTDCFTSTLNLQ